MGHNTFSNCRVSFRQYGRGRIVVLLGLVIKVFFSPSERGKTTFAFVVVQGSREFRLVK